MNASAEQFFGRVKLENCRVQHPDDVVFLCGGLINNNGRAIKSLRDLLYKNRTSIFGTAQVLLAETAAAEFDSNLFSDLLELEEHIAAVARVVLLVSESPGAIAELGSFSQIPEIRRKLLVLMHSNHYNASSFIKDGPVRYLENRKQESVQEFEWRATNKGTIRQEGVAHLLDPLRRAADKFLVGQPKTNTVKKDSLGHRILIVAGIIFNLRCCKLREIAQCARILGLDFSEAQLKQYIFCLKLVGWVRVVKRDVQYYIYTSEHEPVIFRGPRSHSDFSEFDSARVRFNILQGYQSDDPRFSVLDSVAI